MDLIILLFFKHFLLLKNIAVISKRSLHQRSNIIFECYSSGACTMKYWRKIFRGNFGILSK